MLIFANLFVFSQEAHRILSRGLLTTHEALDFFERMPEALEARQVEEALRILSRGLQTTREALDFIERERERFERMLEALRQVDIVDEFVNEFVINCVNFCITDCVFTGWSA